MNLAGIEKKGRPGHKWQFQGVEKEQNFSLNWQETIFRGYDPQLGRFHQVDLFTSIFPSINGYHYALNNPISLNDPTGLCPECEDNVKDPYQDQIYESSGGAYYVYDESQGWVRQGGMLPEITVEGEAIQEEKELSSQAGQILAGTLFTTTGLVADDATVVGVVDDVAIPFVVLGGLAWAAYEYLFGGDTGTETGSPAIPVAFPDTKADPSQGMRIALGVDHDLANFATQTRSVPYNDPADGWGLDVVADMQAFRMRLITIGMAAESIHFNLSDSKGGKINSPTNLKVYADKYTTMEYEVVTKLFLNKTTFYKKSGTIYKKTNP